MHEYSFHLHNPFCRGGNRHEHLAPYSKIKQVNPKEISPEYSLEGLMAEAEAPILWPPDAKNQLIEKDPDAGKDQRWEEKGMTDDKIAGLHH